MRRGDVVTVAASGDYGKPRPAVVVQTDAISLTSVSVVICQMTSTIRSEETARVVVDPSDTNGLRTRSHVMTDKPITVWRSRVGRTIGRLDDADMTSINIALAFVMGLGD